MHTNLLKLNDAKTEFIALGTPQQMSLAQDLSIKIGKDLIHRAGKVWNLGFMMDKFMKNSVHINHLSSFLYVMIKNIARIRPFLDKETCKTIVQALIASRLDYCNSLLLGSSEYQLDKLQCIQNMACRVICNRWKFDHISADMRELHWLCIKEWIIYKIAILTFQCRSGTAPVYLKEVLPAGHIKTLHSANNDTLPVTKSKLALVHKALFQSMAPRIWNDLPRHIRCENNEETFKNKLKTHLFNISYDA